MQKFFHTTSVNHPIGTILHPGRFGAANRSHLVRQSAVSIGELNTLAWESALEVARRCIVPSAPSRLDCVFATPSLHEAIEFRRRYRNGSFIFEIHVADHVPIHLGDFESITTTITGKPFLDTFVDAAMSYWTHCPANTLREALIGGQASIATMVP
jgi:hypothetical protein